MSHCPVLQHAVGVGGDLFSGVPINMYPKWFTLPVPNLSPLAHTRYIQWHSLSGRGLDNVIMEVTVQG